MSYEEGDQDRWDELPDGTCCIEEDEAQSDRNHIDSVKVAGAVYVYASHAGPISVQHQAEKVSLTKITMLSLHFEGHD